MGRYDGEDYEESGWSCVTGNHLRERNGMCRRCRKYVGNDGSPNADSVVEEGTGHEG